ncbi:hypothetical protein HZP65_15035 [Elizabethkingia anophelis]|jgi:hypothetical protein|uniref:hypothetical protein n=1 Tax=Flavobacterium lindanitolerans TaxID=428988 RepID=UPI0021A3E5EA|nr:hypothetical protein [Flavobacterium lindanitolerans]MCT4142049.1 hypothetical protein [Elizabethkingia anophelis]MCT4277501.1 hypothetical protein [Elizabethkingia anophelis]MCT4281069.1 hypothetical protein [Elizabethkingia anophelis]MDQ7961459.1 hypothetical protein [Flavobacterium lindanitolerans]
MVEYLLENPQVFVTLIIGVFTVIITWRFSRSNLKIAKEKLEKELFKEFNERYDSLNDDLSKLGFAENVSQLKEIKAISNDSKTLYNILIDYFNLCAEQHYWYKKKRISSQIWNSWHSGMMHYYNSFSVVRDVWEDETKNDGYKSYYLKKNDELFTKYKSLDEPEIKTTHERTSEKH